MFQLIVFPDAIGKVIVVKESHIILTIEVLVKLTISNRQRSELMDMFSSLLRVHSRQLLCKLRVEALLLHLLVVVHLLFFGRFDWVLLVIFIHDLQVNLVMDLKSSHLDFLLPHIVVQLNVVENGINQPLDIRILVTQQFQHNRHHLRLMQHNLPRTLEKQELKKSVQNLLHHFIVLLFGAKEVLEHFYQVGLRHHLGDLFVSDYGGDQHY